MSQLLSKRVSESKWRDRDEQALQALLPLAYGELHPPAHGCLRKECADHTLLSTEPVHEACTRLTQQGWFHWLRTYT